MAKTLKPADVVFLADITAALGDVNPGSTFREVLRADFPAPILDVPRHRVWLRAEVDDYFASRPERVKK